MNIFRRRRAGRRGAALAAALLLSACVNPAFRDSVGEYGALTKAAAAQQNARTAAVAADEEERLRAELAANRADLRLENCEPDAEGVAEGKPPRCTLVLKGGAAIEEAPSFANVAALTGALSSYADNLILLAADPKDDQRSFSESISGLATSLGGLDGAVRKATGAAPGNAAPKLEAVAALVAQGGNMYFAQRRAAALKRIVIAADPVVQSAARLLSGVDGALLSYYRNDLYKSVQAAQGHATRLVNTPEASVEDIRAAQDALFAKVAAYNALGSDTLRFQAIGEAHAKLAAAARRGASAGEMKAAIEAVLELAGTADAAWAAVKPKGKDGDDHQR
ncbi:MAG TPA: hypothetical protein VHM92_11445 [Allosphingosinicella sp.]|nr:hypothetical protein [Allosphingosinicella sp.]